MSKHGSAHFISPGLMMRLWMIMIGNPREDNFAKGSWGRWIFGRSCAARPFFRADERVTCLPIFLP
jgi:hypothetical protein